MHRHASATEGTLRHTQKLHKAGYNIRVHPLCDTHLDLPRCADQQVGALQVTVVYRPAVQVQHACKMERAATGTRTALEHGALHAQPSSQCHHRCTAARASSLKLCRRRPCMQLSPRAASRAMPSRRGQLSCLATCTAKAAREAGRQSASQVGRPSKGCFSCASGVLQASCQLPSALQLLHSAHQPTSQAHLGILQACRQQLVDRAPGSILHDQAGGLARDGQQVAHVGVVQLAHHRGCGGRGRGAGAGGPFCRCIRQQVLLRVQVP